MVGNNNNLDSYHGSGRLTKDRVVFRNIDSGPFPSCRPMYFDGLTLSDLLVGRSISTVTGFPQIEDSMWGRSFVQVCSRGVGRQGWFGQACDDAIDDVVDVSEVSRKLSAAEDIDRVAINDLPSERKVGHVWSSPGTICSKKAKACRGDSVEATVALCHELIGTLGCSVKAHWMVDLIRHREGSRWEFAPYTELDDA